ncbi:MAG: hypothetical protein D4R65_09565 [Verrucomicrobiaceae bacterium]|nr:MAG: hypothetical protein D4R65_09565 [Verrucomicrobiaceae bacterium]
METTASSGGARALPEDSPKGLTAELLRLTGSLGRHLETLGALAGEEAREAGALALRLAVMIFAALFFAAFGYVLAVISAAFLIAAVFHVSWIWILPAFVLLHVLLAVFCIFHVKSHWRTPLFTVTRSEISRDLDALRGGGKP